MDRMALDYSRKKLAGALAGGVLLAIGGIVLTLLPEAELRTKHMDATYVHFMGYVCGAFFVLATIFAARKLWDRHPAYIFDMNGVSINIGKGNYLIAPWCEIVGYVTKSVKKQQFLVVLVKNPEGYLSNGGFVRRALESANHKMFGSPIMLSANAAEMDFANLKSMFERYYQKYAAPEQAHAQRTV